MFSAWGQGHGRIGVGPMKRFLVVHLPTQARARMPGGAPVPGDAAGEQRDRAALLRAFEVLSDRVTTPWNDGLVLELAPPTRPGGAGGDERAVADRALVIAGALGHHARVGVADDPVAARAVAGWLAPDGGAVVVAPGEGARTLAPLPLVSLHPDDALRVALRVVGVETVGQWASLDPAAVAGRYGARAARLHRVARGGTAPLARIERGDDPERPSARVVLAGATSHAELTFVLPGLLREVVAQLGAHDRAAVRLRIALRLESRSGCPSTAAIVLRTDRPTRSQRTLEKLVRARLERLAVEAPIEEIGIEVVESAPDAGWPPGPSDRVEVREPLPERTARVPAPVLGPVVQRAELVESQERWEHGWPLPRPSLLLSVAERIEFGIESEPRDRPVRIGNPLDRESWAVELEGRGLWVYREPAEAWWVHGWFD